MDIIFCLFVVFVTVTYQSGPALGFAATAAVYALMPYRRGE